MCRLQAKGKSMESLLWALDLIAVIYLCIWALRQDDAESGKKKKSKAK
jgi:hypothetical protein